MDQKLKILTVATSAAPMLNGKPTGLYLSELTHFLDVIDRAGIGWDIASPEGRPIPLDENSVTPKQLADPVNARFMAMPDFTAALEAPLAAADADPDRYAAVFLAGGHGTMWDFRQTPAVQQLLTRMYDAGRYVTGVCHGVSGFVDAVDGQGNLLVAGRRVTGFSNLEDKLAGTKHLMPFLLEDALKSNGAHFKKCLVPFAARVEVDGLVITGQNPRSARPLAEALLEELRTAQKRRVA